MTEEVVNNMDLSSDVLSKEKELNDDMKGVVEINGHFI